MDRVGRRHLPPGSMLAPSGTPARAHWPRAPNVVECCWTMTRCVAARSIAISAPELAAPTTSTGPTGSWGGIAVVQGVQLPDAGVERAGEVGNLGGPVHPGGQDDVVVAEGPRRRGRHVGAGSTRQLLDRDPGTDRQPEPGGVGLQVVGHLVLGRQVRPAGRERHAGQRIVAGRREQAQRVPQVPPRIAHTGPGVEDEEAPTALPQAVPGGQPCPPATDDQGLDACSCRSSAASSHPASGRGFG